MQAAARMVVMVLRTVRFSIVKRSRRLVAVVMIMATGVRGMRANSQVSGIGRQDAGVRPGQHAE